MVPDKGLVLLDKRHIPIVHMSISPSSASTTSLRTCKGTQYKSYTLQLVSAAAINKAAWGPWDWLEKLFIGPFKI